MEIRVLRYFLAVAQELNMTKASKKLHVSQPTISRQLKELEIELGVPLFNRSKHKIELTEHGDYLVQQAKHIISIADQTTSNMNQNKDLSGSITIGSGESPAVRLIAKAIKSLIRQYPHIRVNIVSTNADEVSKGLRTGIFDFGVVLGPTNKQNFNFLTLPIENIWGLLMPRDTRLARKRTITPASLNGLKLIASTQTGVNQQFDEWLGGTHHTLNIVSTYNLLYNASLLVSAGVGYALTFDGILNLNGTNLVFRPLYPQLTAQSTLIWNKEASSSSPAQALLKEIVKVVHANASK